MKFKYLQNFRTFYLYESAEVEQIKQEEYANETVPSLPFNNQVTTDKENFLKKLTFISKKLGIKPEWMMINIGQESGFKADIVNPNGGATGLIQFMPNTIKEYTDSNTKKTLTTEDLKKMSATQQLDVVYAYYKHGMELLGLQKFNEPGDFFGMTFYPKVIKESMDYKFPDNVITQNKSFFTRIGGTSKRDYYAYCAKIANDPEAMKNATKNFEKEGFFGSASGANMDLFSDMANQLQNLVGSIVSKNPGVDPNIETK